MMRVKLMLLVAAILLAACQPVSPTPTSTASQPPTTTPQPTPTDLLAPTPILRTSTPPPRILPELEAISGETVQLLTEVIRFGEGRVKQVLCPGGGRSPMAVFTTGLHVLDPETLEVQSSYHPLTALNRISLSPDGSILALGSMDGTLTIWDTTALNSTVPLKTIRAHSYEITNLDFSPDGKELATASIDRTVRVWRVGDWKRLRNLGGFLLGVTSVAYSDDGKRLAGGSLDGTARMWKVPSGDFVMETGTADSRRSDPRKAVLGVAISEGSYELQVVTRGGNLEQWESVRGTLIHSRELDTTVDLVKIDNSGAYMLTDGDNNLRMGRSSEDWGHEGSLIQLDDQVESLDFCGDAEHVLIGVFPGQVLLIDQTNGIVKEAPGLKGTGAPVTSGAFLNNRQFAAGYTSGEVRIWDIQTGSSTVISRDLEGAGIVQMIATPEGGILYATSLGMIVEYDAGIASDPTKTPRLKLPTKLPLRAFTLSKDGKTLFLIASAEERIHVVDRITGNFLGVFPALNVSIDALAVSPDGSLLAAAGSDNTIRTWETADVLNQIQGQADAIAPVQTIPAGYSILALAFNSTGDQLAIANTSGQVRVVDPVSGSLKFYLSGHKDQVFSILYSTNGAWIITGSADKKLRIYSSVKGQLLTELSGSISTVNHLSVSPDGTLILAGSEDGVIRGYGFTRVVSP